MLKELETDGYVELETAVINGRNRKIYSLSGLGVDAYRASAQVWAMVLPQIETAVKEAGVETPCCTTMVIDSSIIELRGLEPEKQQPANSKDSR